MGTSKSYSEARKAMMPNWKELSNNVTRSCDGGNVSREKLNNILGNYTSLIGGANRSGRGNSKIAGRSGIKTAKKLGSFIGGFIASGGDLSQTLSQTGLTDLTGKSVDDIVNHLIEYCSGPASTIDDRAAKEASRILMEEMVGEASNIQELEENLKATFDNESLEDVMIKYFGYYILEHLSSMFYEHLVKEKGKSDCSNLFRQIKDYIFVELEQVNRNTPLNSIDWGGNEADRLIKNIQENVLTVFES